MKALSLLRLGSRAVCVLCVACLLSSCMHDLCYNHDEHSSAVRVDTRFSWELEWERNFSVDWEEIWKDHWNPTYDELRPRQATGVRAKLWHESGRTDERHLPAQGGRLPMSEGTNEILFYNNDTEYIVYDGLVASSTAIATTRPLPRGSFKALHEGERTVNQPDMLYANYLEAYEAHVTFEPDLLPVTLHPLVYTYLVRYKFVEGLQYVALARGALAGMAESVYLSDGHTGDAAATVMYDGTVEDFGVEARVRCFGVPNYPGDHYTRGDGSPAHIALNLEVRMYNGKFKTFEFDVTEQVLSQPRGGIIIVDDLAITADEGGGGGGGFDVDVDGWGEQIDIPLPLG